jgi:hypothetical protein
MGLARGVFRRQILHVFAGARNTREKVFLSSRRGY